jgi:hypothetical protein
MKTKVTSGITSLRPHHLSGDFIWELYDNRTLETSNICGEQNRYRLTQQQYDAIMDAYDETAKVKTIIAEIQQAQDDAIEQECQQYNHDHGHGGFLTYDPQCHICNP